MHLPLEHPIHRQMYTLVLRHAVGQQNWPRKETVTSVTPFISKQTRFWDEVSVSLLLNSGTQTCLSEVGFCDARMSRIPIVNCQESQKIIPVLRTYEPCRPSLHTYVCTCMHTYIQEKGASTNLRNPLSSCHETTNSSIACCSGFRA